MLGPMFLQGRRLFSLLDVCLRCRHNIRCALKRMNCQSHTYKGIPPEILSRRWFLKECGVGLGAIALKSLLSDYAVAATRQDPLAPKKPHFEGKAKSVIYLFMAGAPSHLE